MGKKYLTLNQRLAKTKKIEVKLEILEEWTENWEKEFFENEKKISKTDSFLTLKKNFERRIIALKKAFLDMRNIYDKKNSERD